MLREPVMMRFNFRESVLFRVSRLREGREGEIVLFSGDMGLRRRFGVGM